MPPPERRSSLKKEGNKPDFSDRKDRFFVGKAKTNPVSQISDLIRSLKELVFDGPYSDNKHQFMMKEQRRLTILTPHERDISREFLVRILRPAKIAPNDWEQF